MLFSCVVHLFTISLKIFIHNLRNKFQATSAFDGTRMSKWEEPNGGQGSEDISFVSFFFLSISFVCYYHLKLWNINKPVFKQTKNNKY